MWLESGYMMTLNLKFKNKKSKMSSYRLSSFFYFLWTLKTKQKPAQLFTTLKWYRLEKILDVLNLRQK